MSRRQRFAILHLDAGERRRCFIIGLCMSGVCASVPAAVGCALAFMLVVRVDYDAWVFCRLGRESFGSNLSGVFDHVSHDPEHQAHEGQHRRDDHAEYDAQQIHLEPGDYEQECEQPCSDRQYPEYDYADDSRRRRLLPVPVFAFWHHAPNLVVLSADSMRLD